MFLRSLVVSKFYLSNVVCNGMYSNIMLKYSLTLKYLFIILYNKEHGILVLKIFKKKKIINNFLMNPESLVYNYIIFFSLYIWLYELGLLKLKKRT